MRHCLYVHGGGFGARLLSSSESYSWLATALSANLPQLLTPLLVHSACVVRNCLLSAEEKLIYAKVGYTKPETFHYKRFSNKLM
jgi:hypothetical protein